MEPLQERNFQLVHSIRFLSQLTPSVTTYNAEGLIDLSVLLQIGLPFLNMSKADPHILSASLANDPTASEAVQNFLRSMQGSQALQNPQSTPQSSLHGNPFTTLPDLLPTSTTIPVIDSAPTSLIDNLLSHLPPQLLLLAQETDDISSVDPNSETVQAAIEALSIDQKKEILRKVLRSPQFVQSLGSLTAAIRDGGLPSISDALKVPVENGGFLRRGGVPVGGGDAVEAFLKGLRKSVEEGAEGQKEGEGKMDTS